MKKENKLDGVGRVLELREGLSYEGSSSGL